MENRSEAVSELLLSRLPQPANRAAYQEEVKSLLAKNEKTLRQHQWTVRRIWIFVIAVSLPCLAVAGANYGKPQGNWFMNSVYFWVLFGAIEIAKYHQNQGRVELLKELKQIQLQILDLPGLLNKRDAPGPDKT
ncbi:MAG TPA: hypothetical protein VN176_16145 [Verrucomicrobiae bacterium]|jgi:hypothetical protein|nr:hypothetical protein [Verrucomicrobiae bacterium]